MIFVFDLPASQIRGYYDPHVGMIYRQPAVFVGRSQGERLKELAGRGTSARVVKGERRPRSPQDAQP